MASGGFGGLELARGGLLTAMSNFGRNLEQEMVLDVAHRAAILARHGVYTGTGAWTGCDIWSAGGERLAIGRARRASERSMENGWMEKTIFGQCRRWMMYVRKMPRNAGRNDWCRSWTAWCLGAGVTGCGSLSRQVCVALVFGSAAGEARHPLRWARFKGMKCLPGRKGRRWMVQAESAAEGGR